MKRILIVEDDPTYLHLWKRLLKELGAKECHFVTSPKKAQEVLLKRRIDMLISDILLPDMTGYALAKLAKQSNPELTILLTTGYQTDLSRFDLMGLKCHLLHKPYHDLGGVCLLLKRLMTGENVFQDMDEDSFSENIDHPEITEWTL